MAGGDPQAQPPSSPAGGKGVLAEAVGSMWSALVLGLLAAIFAWFWFGGSGEGEDKEAGVPAGSETLPVSEKVEAGDQGPSHNGSGVEGGPEEKMTAGEAAPLQSHRQADEAEHLGDAAVCNAKTSSYSQDVCNKLVDAQQELHRLRDPNQKDMAEVQTQQTVLESEQFAPCQIYCARQIPPATESVSSSTCEGGLDDTIPFEETQPVLQGSVRSWPATDEETAHFNVQGPVLDVFTADAVQSILQAVVLNDAAGPAEESVVQGVMLDDLPTDASGRSKLQEALLNARSTAETHPSLQDAVLEFPSTVEAVQPKMQERVLNGILSEVEPSLQDANPAVEAAQSIMCNTVENDLPDLIAQKTVLDSNTASETQSSVQYPVLNVSPATTAASVESTSAPFSADRPELDRAVAAPPSYQEADASTTSGAVQSSVKELLLDILPTTEPAPCIVWEDKAALASVLADELNGNLDTPPEIEALDSSRLLQPVFPKLADFDGPEGSPLSGSCEDGSAPCHDDADEKAHTLVNQGQLGDENAEQCLHPEPQPKSLEGDSRMRKIAAVTPMPQHVSVKFRVHYITHSDSQLIAVTGNHESLGEWEVYVPLQSDKDGFWSDAVLLPVDSSVEWKFVMVDNGKIKRWEECGNRSLKTGHDDAEAHQWWGYH
ncbi:starch-binding domain-containing protein 1 [Ambystoma mexicanum]|uniref:starch-binding domain-containing protein 1 n=1 Tax=Ambystoma mexicanum TaxID=8296 RepID=UPI0037E7A66A